MTSIFILYVTYMANTIDKGRILSSNFTKSVIYKLKKRFDQRIAGSSRNLHEIGSSKYSNTA